MSHAIHTEVRTEIDGIAVMTINQPDSKVNVLTQELWQELRQSLRTLKVRPGVTGLVLCSGKPGITIAGADLKFLMNAKMPNDPIVKQFMELGTDTLHMLETMPFPTAIVLDGVALGGGLEVALACDYRFGGQHPRASLGVPEVNLGLIPGWGGTQRLPRIADCTTAVRMLLTGQPITMAEALSAKLVSQVSDSPLSAAIERIQQGDYQTVRAHKQEELPLLERELLKEELLSQHTTPTAATRELVSAIMRGCEQPLQEGLRIEAAAFLRLTGTEEATQRIVAFLESRKKPSA